MKDIPTFNLQLNRVFLLLLLFATFVYADKDIKHVLVLHSYNQSMSWVQNIDKAIEETLQPSDNGYIIHTENMDTKKLNNAEYIQELKHIYSLKYKNINFDLILSSDNNAFDFLKEYRDEIFGSIPVSFCGVNFFQDEDLIGFKNATGVSEVLDAKSTVKTALKLYPQAKNIFIINDYLKTGRAWEKAIKEQLKDIDKNIQITYSKNQSLEELQDTISNLSKETIVLLGAYFKDSVGTYFTYEKIGESIVSKSKNPVFCLLEFNLRGGVVGGNVISGYYQGEAMSKIGLKILDGKDVTELPVLKYGVTKNIYDYTQMQMFHMDLSKLPKNSIVLNKPSSFYEKNKNILHIGLFLTAILLLTIVILLLSREKIKKSKKELEKIKNNLEVLVKVRTQRLEKSENRYRRLFEDNKVATLIIDPNNGTIIDANKKASTYYNYSNEEFKQMNISDINIMPEEDIQKEIENARREVRDEFYFKHKLADGEVRDVQVYSGPIEVDNTILLYSTVYDITEKVNLFKELEIQKNRFSLAIEGAQDGLWDWNLETNAVILSERFETMLDYNVGDLPHNQEAWFGLLHPDDKEHATEQVQKYLDTKGKASYESSFRLRAKDGSWRWILGRGKAQFSEDGKPLRFVGFNTDITEQKEYQDKLDHTAKHDSLTHLPNRFLLSELLTQAMHTTKRNDKQLALLFIDLDGFKEVNDIYGHDAGDEVLSVVASRMENIVRESDIVSRIGGDEFVIVITDINKSEELTPILQHLLSDITLSIKYNENNMHVSASIGVSLYPQNIDIGNEALLRQADQAMYIAKTEGRNRYHFFNIEASDELKEQQQNIKNFRDAIGTNQFVLYYQPKVDMKTNKVVGLEALLRWNHPSKGLLYPDEFLPLIDKDSTLMIELGKWVFEHAFRELETWQLKGLEIVLSVNASAHEIQDVDFPVYLKTLFNKYPGVKANSVEIELLETAAFSNFELTSQVLKECQKLGVSIAVDDFGTGYASLNYLKKFPMNTLKIDKSFVIDLLHESSSLSIVEASLGLAHAFNLKVVAEGVESEEHGKVLLKIGYTIAQGYVIAKAMPAENVLKWISSYKGFSSWSKTKPIKDRARTALYAAIEHRSWINAMEEFIKGEDENLPNLDANECYLGRWINNCSSEEYLSHSEFKQLQTLHSKLHQHAEELLYSTKSDKLEELAKLKSLHDEIREKLELLTTLSIDE